jgi:hypothetical protein
MTAHDNMAKQVIETLLAKWKIDGDSQILSNGVFLTKSESNFPSPDGTFFDPSNNFSSALEFKPPTETKRGILTGLGQSIAYLDKHSLSYLAIPSRVEHFDMGTYMDRIYEENIKNKMPVALVVYDYQNPTNILIHKEPTVEINIGQLTLSEAQSGRYWAKWIDLPLHALWVLLDISYKIDDEGDRKRNIWNKFFLEYVYPEQYRNQFEEYESEIQLVNGEKYKPMRKKLAKWKKQIEDGILTREEALNELSVSTNIQGTGDITYWQYRKNFFPFIDHIGAWDEFGYLTEIGYELHKIGKIHGPTSRTFYDYVAKILLIEGKHLDLILDIEKYTRNKGFDNRDIAIENVIEKLIEKGLISGQGAKKFTNEFQLWGQLGLVFKESGSYYVRNKGFNFDWEKITSLLA